MIFIRRGKLTQTTLNHFNRGAKHAWLGEYLFEFIAHGQQTATESPRRKNHELPSMAFGGITINEMSVNTALSLFFGRNQRQGHDTTMGHSNSSSFIPLGVGHALIVAVKSIELSRATHAMLLESHG